MISALFVLFIAILSWSILGIGAALIGGDEHYGSVGFGNFTASTVNVFTAVRLGTTIEPTVLIKDVDKRSSVLDIKFDDVLVWDISHWNVRLLISWDVTSQDVNQESVGGVTVDNTSGVNDQPTADTIAQGTKPGGDGATITSGTTTGQVNPRFEMGWATEASANETADATGQSTRTGQIHHPDVHPQPKAVPDNGNWFYKLLTSRAYHAWMDGNAQATAVSASIGAQARRVSVGLDEVLFDRGGIVDILTALQAIT